MYLFAKSERAQTLQETTHFVDHKVNNTLIRKLNVGFQIYFILMLSTLPFAPKQCQDIFIFILLQKFFNENT